MSVRLLVIGGGLSGLAAAIRAARFQSDVLLIEKHSRLGGLNSYFYRNGQLFETGLHAITNYAGPEQKSAPLNRLLRQLKLSRNDLSLCPQLQSEVIFSGLTSLRFSNDFEMFHCEVGEKFPQCREKFARLLDFLASYNPFAVAPFVSAKNFLLDRLGDPLLVDMLLCPLMYYGSSHENDMDLSQFAIMFQAIYREGMFRPRGSIKDFLDLLVNHYQGLGGRWKTGCGVTRIHLHQRRVVGVTLSSGETLECDWLLSTIGHEETLRLLDDRPAPAESPLPRLAFVETIYQVPIQAAAHLPRDRTIIFFNDGARFRYQKPDDYVDLSSGVICFPANFQNLSPKELLEIRSTHLANYDKWQALLASPDRYREQKRQSSHLSSLRLENIIGSFSANIVYENTFTPVTIERYTSKIGGAIYGAPEKLKSGDMGFSNLFLAGTDQGFLGIIGSMLSGVSIVNQHILPKL